MRNRAEIGDRPDIAGAKDSSVPRPRGLDRLGALPIHPFLFAAASVFSLYASNLHEVYFSDAAPALAAALGAALVLFLVFGAGFRNLGAKAAILASATLVAGLFYSEIVDAANRYLGSNLSRETALPIVLATLAVIAVAVTWLRIDFTPVNLVLNCIAFVFFIFPAWQIASHEWRAGGGSLVAFDKSAHAATGALPVADPAKAKAAPDIYYFIFDRYGSQSTLAEYYGFDNGDLIAFLKANGFYVASDSHANYLKTAHSLAATFHMDYLDFLREDQRSKIGDWHPIYDLLKGHRVGRFLKSNGYDFIQIGAWWGPTHHNPSAQENYSYGFRDFDYWYLRKSIIPTILDAVAPSSRYARRMQWGDGQCERVPRQIEKIKKIGKRNETTFVFAHILVPHDPYLFTREGQCLSHDVVKRRTEQEGYLEQVRYANSLIKDLVSTLLATDGPKPIIIIQADEGPFPERYRNSNRSWHDATVDELKMKTGILNAFYFPDGDYQTLDQHVSPVNTFRLVFNKYFDTNLGRLPDRSFAFPDYFKIYDFYDITDIVSAGHAQAEESATHARHIDEQRLQATLEKLSEYGRNPEGGVTRLGFSQPELDARTYVIGLMKDAGLEVRTDPAGNIFGRRAGSEQLPTILFGSHIDSVPNGGNFDGPLGSLGAIEVIRALNDAKVTTRHPLEVVVWTNEEGPHFGISALGSGVAAGVLGPEILDRKDDDGLTVADWLRRYGQDPARLSEARIAPGALAAILELHIEQGPVLEETKTQIGIVTGIVSLKRWKCVVAGFANHAGTTPMNRRKDALAAAAKHLLAVRDVVRAEPGTQVGTVGYMKAEPGAPNVIAGRVEFPIELRDLDAGKIERMWQHIQQKLAQVDAEEGVQTHCEVINEIAAAPSDPAIQSAIREAARSAGLSTADLPSGAVHDAGEISKIAPMGMIFVPSRDGISHSPQEFTSWEDCANGVEVLYRSILLLDRQLQPN